MADMYFRTTAFDREQQQQQQSRSTIMSNPYSSNTNYNNGNSNAYVTPTYGQPQQGQQGQGQHHQYHQVHRSHGGSTPLDNIQFYFTPKQRLNTLFTVHAFMSLIIGVSFYLFPKWGLSFWFTVEKRREIYLARSILRLYCSLIIAQGLVTWRIKSIRDGEVKRAMVQSYFICFALSTLALIYEHISGKGVLSGQFFGIMKIFTMIFLTCGYGWFTFFQPPLVWSNLGASTKGF